VNRSWWVIVIVCLSLCACTARQAGTPATRSNPSVNACIAKLKIFSGPVIEKYEVLGTIRGDRAVSEASRKADRIEATRDACTAHPDANAIVRYSGVVKDNHAWWSGVVVKRR
jgi:hypothetical protein